MMILHNPMKLMMIQFLPLNMFLQKMILLLQKQMMIQSKTTTMFLRKMEMLLLREQWQQTKLMFLLVTAS